MRSERVLPLGVLVSMEVGLVVDFVVTGRTLRDVFVSSLAALTADADPPIDARDDMILL